MTSPRTDLENCIVSRIQQALRKQLEEPVTDIYALSFYVDQDHPYGPTINLSYNTLTQVRKLGGSPEDKWNYACWIQNEMLELGGDDDTQSRQKLTHWLKEFDIDFEDEPIEDADFDAWLEKKESVFKEFWLLCSTVAKRLHEDGIVEQRFGRAIPIIIHDLEYDRASIEATISANPPGLVDEFTSFIAFD